MVRTSWHTLDTGERPREPRVSVIVPELNEARNLREVLPTLPDVHEVILVDGGSVDGTVEEAREALPGIITVTQTGAGKGNALAAGLARATGDVVVMFDADGSGDPRQMPSFVAALVAGADFAKGSRSGPRAGRFLHTWMNRSFRTRLTDRCHGYNALWAD